MLKSTQEIVEMLREHKGATPVSLIVTTTEIDVNGKAFTKINKVNGIIGFRYENSVNNALERNGQDADFQAGSRKWGTHMLRSDGTRVEHLIEHTLVKTGEYKQYVQIKVQSTSKPIYIDDQGRVHGTIEHKKRKETIAESVGVVLRDYNVKNVRRLAYNGQKINIA